MPKSLAKRTKERRVAKPQKGNRQKVYSRLAREVAAAVKELNFNDFTEDYWLLHDLSGILFTVGQLGNSPEEQARLNVFLNQVRTLQLPIRELIPPEPEPIGTERVVAARRVKGRLKGRI